MRHECYPPPLPQIINEVVRDKTDDTQARAHQTRAQPAAGCSLFMLATTTTTTNTGGLGVCQQEC